MAAGFSAVGIAPVQPGLGADRLATWLAKGMHGEMSWMDSRRHLREDPTRILQDARSVVMVALSYRTIEPSPTTAGTARISRYAWGRDYHEELRHRLHQIKNRVRECSSTVHLRPFVDSAPVMERDYARLAGIGWFGKNTLLLNKRLGSWFFLGGLLVDCELHYDLPFEAEHCGTCTACLDACPTHAFDGPYLLDPRRCLSYLTIEHRTAVEPKLANSFKEWLFGCDICQEVCPWNRKAEQSSIPGFLPKPGFNPPSLEEILSLDRDSFDRRFRGTAIHRSGRARLVRNAILIANASGQSSFPALISQLRDDEDPVVREAARGRFPSPSQERMPNVETPPGFDAD